MGHRRLVLVMMKKTPMQAILDQNKSPDWMAGFGMALQLVHRRPEVMGPFAALLSSYFAEVGLKTPFYEAGMDLMLSDMQEAIP